MRSILRIQLPAALLLCAGAFAAPGDEEWPKPEVWITALRAHSDRLPRFSAEWNVVRFNAADPEAVQVLAGKYDEQIRAAATDSEKKQLKHEKSLKVALAAQGQATPFTVKLDYYHNDRFYLALKVPNPTAALNDTEYYQNGDGTVYQVTKQSVRVLPMTKAMSGSLGLFLCALPELVVNRELASIQEWKVLQQNQVSFDIGGVFGRHGVRLTMDTATHRLAVFETGEVVDPKLEAKVQRQMRAIGPQANADDVNFAERDRTVLFRALREDLGFPVPKEVVVRSHFGGLGSACEDLWSPTRIQVQPDPTQMHSPQYEFQPGLKVIDETGEKKRESSSDEVPGKGTGNPAAERH